MSSRAIRRQNRKTRPEVERKEPTQASRRPLLYALTVVILVIITVSFIGAPVISRMGGVARLRFGSYDGRDIEFVRGNYLSSQYDMAAENIRASGQAGTLESQLYQAWRYAFNQTVFHAAVLLEMERSGAWVSEDGVNDSLVDYGPYVVGGAFDQQRYAATPQSERVSVRKLRREELLHDRYLSDLFATDKMGAAEREFLESMAATERRFALVAFSFDQLPDGTVVDFALANRERFQRMKLSRISVNSNEREADQIRQKAISGGSSFDELARSYSKDFYADKGGDMGWQNYHDVQVFFDAGAPVDHIFSLKEGEISNLLESGGTWVFFRADSQAIAPDLEDPETIRAVREYILSSEVGVAEEHFLKQAADLARNAREKGFNQAAGEAGLFPPLETEYAPLNYGSVFRSKPLRLRGSDDQGVLAGAAADEELFRSLYSLKEREVSDPLLVGSRVVVATLLDERPLSDEDRELVGTSLARLVLQQMQQDLPDIIVEDDKLVDDFQTAFFTKILGQQ